MPENDIDFLRARYAIDTVKRRYGSAKSINAKDSKNYPLREYRSIALSAGSFIRQCGLLQVFAFYHSKQGTETALMNDLVRWLASTDSAFTYSICADALQRDPICSKDDTTKILQALVQRDSQEIALLEEEAEAVLLWIKRVVEGIYQTLKKETERKTRDSENPGDAGDEEDKAAQPAEGALG
jgi:CRISPR type III-B/RAMP module-associated protein Cmr5